MNWKDPTLATEYSRNSKPFQRQNIGILDGFGIEQPPSKKAKISGIVHMTNNNYNANYVLTPISHF